jgi:hypothetical protein
MSLFRAASLVQILSCVIVSINVTAPSVHAEGRLKDCPHRGAVIRPLNSSLTTTLHDSYNASATVRAIVDELDRSDLIVHVVAMGPANRDYLAGAMQFIVNSGGRRFLRIAINGRLSRENRAAILGHELQHALEVSRAAAVIDAATFAEFYRRIGQEAVGSPNVECYDTMEARRVGEQVLADVRDSAARRQRSSR